MITITFYQLALILIMILWSYLTGSIGISRHPAGNLILFVVGEIILILLLIFTS